MCPLGRFFGFDEKSKNIVPCESVSFLRSARSECDTVFVMRTPYAVNGLPSFQYYAFHLRRYPNGRGVCIGLWITQEPAAPYNQSVPFHASIRTVRGTLTVFPALCPSISFFAVLNLLLLTKFFSSIRQTANRLLRFVFFFLAVIHGAASFSYVGTMPLFFRISNSSFVYLIMVHLSNDADLPVCQVNRKVHLRTSSKNQT